MLLKYFFLCKKKKKTNKISKQSINLNLESSIKLSYFQNKKHFLVIYKSTFRKE